MKVIRSTCNYCSIACNLDFHVENGEIKKITIGGVVKLSDKLEIEL